MIELSKTEQQWILMCKGHYQEEYPFTGRWVNTLKPLFTKIYGYNPDENENYQSYLKCIFEKLFDIYLKIADDHSGCNAQIKEIFDASFYKSFARDDDHPIERAISQLCGLIQCNSVFDNDIKRYNLDKEK